MIRLPVASSPSAERIDPRRRLPGLFAHSAHDGCNPGTTANRGMRGRLLGGEGRKVLHPREGIVGTICGVSPGVCKSLCEVKDDKRYKKLA